MTIYMGIDPGATGGIAILGPAWPEPHSYHSFEKSTLGDTVTLLMNWRFHEVHAILERQQAMPRQGVSSTFKLGQAYGEIRGVLTALGFRFVEVRPTVWKRGMGVSSDKESSRAMAQQLWPEVGFARVKDHNKAEAYLLAEYGRRMNL